MSKSGKRADVLAVSGNAVDDIGALRKLRMVMKSGQVVVEALSSFAAIALHNRILLEDLKNLLDAFIQAIAKHRHWDREEKMMVPA